MTKARSPKSDPFLILLEFQNTPTEGLNRSPAQLLLGRRTKTLLPISKGLLMPGDTSVYLRPERVRRRTK